MVDNFPIFANFWKPSFCNFNIFCFVGFVFQDTRTGFPCLPESSVELFPRQKTTKTRTQVRTEKHPFELELSYNKQQQTDSEVPRTSWLASSSCVWCVQPTRLLTRVGLLWVLGSKGWFRTPVQTFSVLLLYARCRFGWTQTPPRVCQVKTLKSPKVGWNRPYRVSKRLCVCCL